MHAGALAGARGALLIGKRVAVFTQRRPGKLVTLRKELGNVSPESLSGFAIVRDWVRVTHLGRTVVLNRADGKYEQVFGSGVAVLRSGRAYHAIGSTVTAKCWWSTTDRPTEPPRSSTAWPTATRACGS